MIGKRVQGAASLILIIALAVSSRALGEEPVPAGDETVRIDSELTVRRIAKDTYVVVHEPVYAANVLVALFPDKTVVLCSSPVHTEATQALVRWVRAAFAPKRILDINPHFHPDGTAGNDAYAKIGVETYASGRTQKLLAENGERIRDEAAAQLDPALGARVKATRIVAADHTFEEKDGLTLTLGGETVRVIYPGPAHSPDNVVVYFPARDLVFGGCMIRTGPKIGNLIDADLGRWEASVHAVEKLGAHIVVPGHGPVGGAELFQNTIALVRAARP